MINIVKEIIPNLNISIDQTKKLEIYYDYLIEKNKVMNLTAITNKEDVYRKHFADSILIFKSIPLFNNEKILDVGSGAGFPGIVIKIFCPEIKLTIVEASKKRCIFLSNLVKKLNLSDVEIIHGRAEEVSRNLENTFDFAVCRAVSQISILLELLVRFLKINGQIICYKGPQIESELSTSEIWQKKLFLQMTNIFNFQIKDLGERNILFFTKLKATPVLYPRNFAQIKKSHRI